MQASNQLKKYLFVSIFLLSLFQSFAQKRDKKLEQKIATLIQGFNGQIGVYVKSLRNGQTVSINGDTTFHDSDT
jgi:beta-lactamase class A